MSHDPIAHPVAVNVTSLSKRYRLGARQPYRRAGEAVARAILRPFRGPMERRTRDWIWALNDITFSLNRGEILGIIGANGSGKTTLLRVLSKITRPTSGRAEIHGRVGALLEVGTGFHPELTGRENVFLNGAILGMSRSEVNRKFDEIVAFADINEFLETPVKHYSSGMRVRLAFSVAAHLEPEILFIDEVLAVGDADFQQKSLGKMQEVASSGRTVLFVSHNLGAVTSLCTRCIWLREGRIVMDGEPQAVVEEYLSEGEQSEGRWEHPETSDCGERVRILSVEVSGDSAVPKPTLSFEEPIQLRIECLVSEPMERMALAISLYDLAGTLILATTTTDAGEGPTLWEPGRYRYSVQIPGGMLRSTKYFLTILAKTFRLKLDEHEHCLVFDVAPARLSPGAKQAQRKGVLAPILPWQLEEKETSA